MDINRHRIVQDKDNVGGLRAVYFSNYDEDSYTGGLAPVFATTDSGGTALPTGDTLTNTVIDQLGTSSWYKYDLRGTSTLSQSLNASRDNGTIFVEQTLTLSLKKLSEETHADIYALAAQRPHIIVEDYNGNLQLVGLEYGADMVPSAIESGAAMGDLSGYSFVFTAMEKRPANFVRETAIWTAGNTGSTAPGDYYTDITLNGTVGTATR